MYIALFGYAKAQKLGSTEEACTCVKLKTSEHCVLTTRILEVANALTPGRLKNMHKRVIYQASWSQ